MPSQAQADAARRNGAKSRGPITAEGKARASRNALKHGFTADTLVLTNESSPQFQALLDDYNDYFDPASLVEVDLVFEIVPARWRMRRIWSIETALLDFEMDRQAESIQEKIGPVDQATRLALAWSGQVDSSKALPLLNRYESRLRRQFEKALANLKEVQANRPSPVGQPILAAAGLPPGAPQPSEPNEPEPLHPDPAQPEPLRPEPNKPEPVRPDPAKPEPTKPEPPAPVQNEPGGPPPEHPIY